MNKKLEGISHQIRNLGVQDGDLLFVSADLLRVGYFRSNTEETLKDWIELLTTLVGTNGTIILPSYSEVTLRYKKHSEFVFTAESLSNSGSLVNGFIKYGPNIIRSTHPAMSCIGFGPLAPKILQEHTGDSAAYLPYEIITKMKGKNLMLGTVDSKNCPMTFHLAQQHLGHTLSHPLCGLLKTRFKDEHGDMRTHILRDLGGCTRGVYKQWVKIIEAGAVKFGNVGRTVSALVDCDASYDVMVRVLEEHPRTIRCDDYYCLSCRGRVIYNGMGVLSFYPRAVARFIARWLTVARGRTRV
jgi:aminoglycoside N3'-acetyltransferase